MFFFLSDGVSSVDLLRSIKFSPQIDEVTESAGCRLSLLSCHSERLSLSLPSPLSPLAHDSVLPQLSENAPLIAQHHLRLLELLTFTDLVN